MFTRISQQYRDAVAVVVGAGGIGVEISRLLHSAGARLAVADHAPAALESLVARLAAAPAVSATAVSATGATAESGRDTGAPVRSPPGVLTSPLDVRDPAAIEAFFGLVEEKLGAPRFCFYTAGVLTIEPLLETRPEQWQRVVDVNLNGAFYCLQSASRRMVPHRCGSILLLGSIAGTKARSGSRVNPVYNATKAAVAALVNAAAMQLRPHAIRVNCISPGPTATAMMDVQPPAVHAAVRDITLDGRMNRPDEVAELALFVAAQGRFTGEDVGLGGGAGLGG